MIKFISSAEYQVAYVQGGFGISYHPEANKPENYAVKPMYKFVQWGMDPALRRMGPVLSANALRVFEYWPGMYPTYEDVLDSIYLGSAGFDALAGLDKRRIERLETAIKKAQEAGIKVTRADFAFPDRYPTKDYIQKGKK